MKNMLMISILTGTSLLAFANEYNDIKVHDQPGTTQTQEYTKPADDVLKMRLTSLQYSVTQHDATESPFENEYWDEKRQGIYVDIVSGEPLFSSKDKFKSGTGWPSFSRPLVNANIVERSDNVLFFLTRTEVRSKNADSHLGHVFNDGPKSTGLRYCINSAAIQFISKEKLQEKGYGSFLKTFDLVGQ